MPNNNPNNVEMDIALTHDKAEALKHLANCANRASAALKELRRAMDAVEGKSQTEISGVHNVDQEAIAAAMNKFSDEERALAEEVLKNE